MLLPAGRELCQYLSRVDLAPSTEQAQHVRFERGRLNGPIDPPSLARRIGQRTSPRLLPVRTVVTHHNTPENVIAASAAWSLVRELQVLIGRTRLPSGSSEALLAVRILDAARASLATAPLVDVASEIVDLGSERCLDLLGKVDERWRRRRISNRAYAQIAQWSHRHRDPNIAPTGLLSGLTYGDAFDNRLFEIFTLWCVRVGLEQLGYERIFSRPLHLRKQGPVLCMSHPDSDVAIEVHFQRAAGVLWTSAAPKIWPDITGIPDIVLTSSSSHPVILIDAKNKDRGSPAKVGEDEEPVGRHATSDEAHKMLGYFTNFSRRCRVGDRGPVGGLVFSRTTGASEPWIARVRSRRSPRYDGHRSER